MDRAFSIIGDASALGVAAFSALTLDRGIAIGGLVVAMVALYSALKQSKLAFKQSEIAELQTEHARVSNIANAYIVSSEAISSKWLVWHRSAAPDEQELAAGELLNSLEIACGVYLDIATPCRTGTAFKEMLKDNVTLTVKDDRLRAKISEYRNGDPEVFCNIAEFRRINP